MKSPRWLLEDALQIAGQALLGADFPAAPLMKSCVDRRHGDYQANVALVLAKKLNRDARELAKQLVAQLGTSPIFGEAEIAGPGFINFRLEAQFCATKLVEADTQGPVVTDTPQTIVIDFGGPNIAKEMHVGHLRSLVLGEALARIYRYLGHRVITDNHLGDWGTQFGFILLGYKQSLAKHRLDEEPMAYLEEVYQATFELAKSDPEVRAAAKRELVKLQKGDPENLELWRRFSACTRSEMDKLCLRLGIHFDHHLGESFYNDRLPELVDRLLKSGVARVSEGATCIFFEEDPLLKDHPCLIQKADEGYLYATTDLATLEYRWQEWRADKIFYVTDGRQQLHFKQLFAVAPLLNLPMALEHVWFGAILGEDKKPLKTREGQPIKLRQLLNEAVDRALALITTKRLDLSLERRQQIARVVGLGALKYADLGQNRNLDYVFSWDKLLSFEGNTAPYLQNAYVRICSIIRKADELPQPDQGVVLLEAAELELGKKILEFGDALEAVTAEQRPHFLCSYLYELAVTYHHFYENCPVLKADREFKLSRLRLCQMTARVLCSGLDLLGIETVEEM
jgi:arginyl-tRNA synthetase